MTALWRRSPDAALGFGLLGPGTLDVELLRAALDCCLVQRALVTWKPWHGIHDRCSSFWHVLSRSAFFCPSREGLVALLAAIDAGSDACTLAQRIALVSQLLCVVANRGPGDYLDGILCLLPSSLT